MPQSYFFFSIFSPSPAPRAIPGVPGYLVDDLKKVFFLLLFSFPPKTGRYDMAKRDPDGRRVRQRHSVCGPLPSVGPLSVSISGFPTRRSPSRLRDRSCAVAVPYWSHLHHHHGLGSWDCPLFPPRVGRSFINSRASRPRFYYVGFVNFYDTVLLQG